MAQDDYSWWGGDGDFGELDASDLTQDILFDESSEDFDAYAQQLFVEAFFDQSEQAYEDLISYMWDEYGIDFEEAFDWADFREWYG